MCIKIVRGAECEVQCPVQSAEIGVRLLRHRFFRQCGSTALQKTIRQSLFTIRRRFLPRSMVGRVGYN